MRWGTWSMLWKLESTKHIWKRKPQTYTNHMGFIGRQRMPCICRELTWVKSFNQHLIGILLSIRQTGIVSGSHTEKNETQRLVSRAAQAARGSTELRGLALRTVLHCAWWVTAVVARDGAVERAQDWVVHGSSSLSVITSLWDLYKPLIFSEHQFHLEKKGYW